MIKNNKATLGPPDGGWGWIIVVGVSLINFSTRPIEPSFGLLFGDLLKDLSIATTGAGIIVSTYEAVVNFSGLFVGPLIKKYSFRKVAFVGSLLVGLGLLVTFPAASMAHILITYSIINGLGVGFAWSASFVSLNHYFKKRRGQAVGITMAGTGVGLLLMPQAVRYLTEEYDFAGSILIIGAFSLNGCVGSTLLQPAKWHLKEIKPDEEKMIPEQDQQQEIPDKHAKCPDIVIDNTIEEHDEENEEVDSQNNERSVIDQQKETEEALIKKTPEKPKFYLKYERQITLSDDEKSSESSWLEYHKDLSPKILNKSSTEPKFEKYFEENLRKICVKRKTSECPNAKAKHTSICSINKSEYPISAIPTSSSAIFKKRKSSTISTISHLDFTGSGLQLHAVEHDVKDKIKKNKEIFKEDQRSGKDNEKEESLWQRFSAFMDFDLLKDPIFLNILFGLSIFYVAEFNFKMVVPFFLSDLGHSKSEIAFCLSMMAASDIVARVVLPPICDRLTKISRRTMTMVAAVFCLLSRSALAETAEWFHLETILIISGFFRGATLINFMLVISEYCDTRLEKLPAAFGIQMCTRGIFIVLFGPLIGLIRDITGSFPLCIHSQSVLIVLFILAWSIEYLVVYMKSKKNKS